MSIGFIGTSEALAQTTIKKTTNSRTTTAKKNTVAPTKKSTSKKILAKQNTSHTKKSFQTEKEKARIESQKASVEQKLTTLEKALNEKEAASNEAANELKKADQAISDANRKLRELKTERNRIEAQLAELTKDNRLVNSDLGSAERRVEQIARAQYMNLRRQSWQEIIDGSNPNIVSRDAASLRYLAREQIRAINQLEQKQLHIRSVSEETRARRTELAKVSQAEEKERRQLVLDKKEREKALTKLKSDIRTQQANLDRLRRDQTRLSNLVAVIDKRLANEKAAEARRVTQQAKTNSSPSKTTQKPPQDYTPVVSNFGQLKGKLTRPTNGRTIAVFGQRRSATSIWQGIQIRAPEGSDVVACASGKIVFSDWLRGFGNLIIIDHGNTYMSIYANNESIYKSVGDKVKQGETISSVGSSGGDGEPGLYFELRYRGKPINPSAWLSQR